MLSFGGISYAYNGDGNRVSQTASSIVTKYLLDTQPGLALVIAQTMGANTERYIHAPRGIHAIENQAGNWSYMLQDGLGSVRGVVEATGTAAASHNYSPYGVPDAPLTGFAFTGEQRDGTGIQYHRARYYAPQLGSWISLDPIETLNRFAYVDGNIVNQTDHSGKQGDNCAQYAQFPRTNSIAYVDCLKANNQNPCPQGYPVGGSQQTNCVLHDGTSQQAAILWEQQWGLKDSPAWEYYRDVPQGLLNMIPPEVQLLLGISVVGFAAVLGGVYLGSAAFTIGVLGWTSGYVAYNYGPRSDNKQINDAVDILTTFTGWQNVKWAIDACSSTGNPLHLVPAVVNTALGFTVFQAISQLAINVVTRSAISPTQAALTDEAARIAAQRGSTIAPRITTNAPANVTGNYAGYHNAGSIYINPNRPAHNVMGTLSHEMTHFFQWASGNSIDNYFLNMSKWATNSIETGNAFTKVGGLFGYYVNPAELQAVANGGQALLSIVGSSLMHTPDILGEICQLTNICIGD